MHEKNSRVNKDIREEIELFIFDSCERSEVGLNRFSYPRILLKGR